MNRARCLGDDVENIFLLDTKIALTWAQKEKGKDCILFCEENLVFSKQSSYAYPTDTATRSDNIPVPGMAPHYIWTGRSRRKPAKAQVQVYLPWKTDGLPNCRCFRKCIDMVEHENTRHTCSRESCASQLTKVARTEHFSSREISETFCKQHGLDGWHARAVRYAFHNPEHQAHDAC